MKISTIILALKNYLNRIITVVCLRILFTPESFILYRSFLSRQYTAIYPYSIFTSFEHFRRLAPNCACVQISTQPFFYKGPSSNSFLSDFVLLFCDIFLFLAHCDGALLFYLLNVLPIMIFSLCVCVYVNVLCVFIVYSSLLTFFKHLPTKRVTAFLILLCRSPF